MAKPISDFQRGEQAGHAWGVDAEPRRRAAVVEAGSIDAFDVLAGIDDQSVALAVFVAATGGAIDDDVVGARRWWQNLTGDAKPSQELVEGFVAGVEAAEKSAVRYSSLSPAPATERTSPMTYQTSAADRMEAAIVEHMDRTGKPRSVAAAETMRANPTLRTEMLREANPRLPSSYTAPAFKPDRRNMATPQADRFRALVRERANRDGVSKGVATSQIVRENPSLHRAMLVEANS